MEKTINDFYIVQQKLTGILNMLNSSAVNREELNRRLMQIGNDCEQLMPFIDKISHATFRNLLLNSNEFASVVTSNATIVLNKTGIVENLPSEIVDPKNVKTIATQEVEKVYYNKVNIDDIIASETTNDNYNDNLIETVSEQTDNNTGAPVNSSTVTAITKTLVDHNHIYMLYTQLGNIINMQDYQDFKYLKELKELLSLSTREFKTPNFAKLARYQWTALVAQALLLNNVANVKLEMIKSISVVNNNARTKLKCLLNYLNNICMIMRNGDQDYLTDWAFVKKYNAIKPLSLLNSTKPILFDKIKIMREENINTPLNFDEEIYTQSKLNVIYANNFKPYPEALSGLALSLQPDDTSSTSVNFCEYPELYATLNYIPSELDVDACVLMIGFLKANEVQLQQNGLVYVNDIVKFITMHQHFLVVTSEKSKFDKNIRLNDKNVLNQTLGTYAVGIRKYFYNLKKFNKDVENNYKGGNVVDVANVVTDKDFIKYEDDDDEHFNDLDDHTEDKYDVDHDTILCTRPHGRNNHIFKFFTECVVAMHFGIGIEYYAKNDEQQYEIENGLATLKTNNHLTVGALYKKLLQYNFKSLAQANFK
ncbi:poly ADP-ribose glycohydrolase [Orgyia leucostigma nucleopolyhedrovirus]|uniref:Poly ADP-ribose glycohydrolase n=1 Tax=Orgyia leucostigma nucleopolyhedrovirus TaxID=490711 RepID=B0FDW9_9ABAC|nr:poly ADP-ribose glycohydrolase [Orgyia leucostigma nucleopolyhedrovirus]ABY65827.1 poly ADP-ribose glycohydrolase [Orgyia leucostigma nucleopolyhedrovirus]